MNDILIIKRKWLDKIFHGGKCLEIRGSNTNKRGLIDLAESGSSFVRGYCTLENSYPIQDEEHWEKLKEFHQVDLSWEEIKKRYKKPHAWVFVNIHEYNEPKPYIHPQGAVIWVKARKGKGQE